MANYYEILELPTSATSAKIEERLDALYSQYNSLITSTNQEIVEQAKQSLALISEMRDVLMDASKRKVYDRAIGVGEQIGGLVDLDQILSEDERSLASNRKKDKKSNESQERTDAWICDCGKANPIGTLFCRKCGENIASYCPNCEDLSPRIDVFCFKCGENKEDFFHKNEKEVKKLNDEIIMIQTEITSLKDGALPLDSEFTKDRNNTLESNRKFFIFIIGLGIVATILVSTSSSGGQICGVILYFFIVIWIWMIIQSFFELPGNKKSYIESLDEKIKEINSEISAIKRKQNKYSKPTN